MGPSKILIGWLYAFFAPPAQADLSRLLTRSSRCADALIGPIKYNSTTKTSKRFAGSALVPDLKQRNQVGEWLGCPAYR